jgi:hypothetical protein
MKKAVSYSFLFFISSAAFLCNIRVSRADIAAKSYVDSMRDSLNAAKPDKKIPSETGNLAALDKDGGLADSGIRGPSVATKSYVDAAVAGIPPPPKGPKGKAVTSASAGDTFSVAADGFEFRAVKQTNSDYWGLRIVNTAKEAAQVVTKSQHFYNSNVQTTGKNVVLANGAELNPDTEAGNLGYGGDAIFVVHMFDTTNMNYYVVNFGVLKQKAILTVEQLY